MSDSAVRNSAVRKPGAVAALRTFRIGPDGMLYPLASNVAWQAGTNTCRCRLLIPDANDSSRPAVHSVPGPACSCGFHGYASECSLAQHRQARQLVAVIECSGNIIAGPRGVRAERASIAAIWASRTLPSDLIAAIRARYPDAVVYRDKSAMLREHPPTRLECYTSDRRYFDAGKRLSLAGIAATALVLGALPAQSITDHRVLFICWAAVLTSCALASVAALGAGVSRARASALLMPCAAIWLAAPFAGTAYSLVLRLIAVGLLVLARHRRL